MSKLSISALAGIALFLGATQSNDDGTWFIGFEVGDFDVHEAVIPN